MTFLHIYVCITLYFAHIHPHYPVRPSVILSPHLSFMCICACYNHPSTTQFSRVVLGQKYEGNFINWDVRSNTNRGFSIFTESSTKPELPKLLTAK